MICRCTRSRIAGALIIAAVLGAWLLGQPSNNRTWTPSQAVLPDITFDGDSVTISQLRDFRWRSAEDFDVQYRTASYDLNQVTSLWYVIVPFSSWKGPAHTLLSFGFADGRYLAVSVEARKEEQEKYTPLRGLFDQYELMYVIGTEEDILQLRTHVYGDDVYVYPMKAEPEHIQSLLTALLQEADQLQDTPVFYNTLTNACVTNLVAQVNAIWPGRIPMSYRIILPAYSDEYAYELGLLDTDLPFTEARSRYHINERALQYGNDPAFSRLIRAAD